MIIYVNYTISGIIVLKDQYLYHIGYNIKLCKLTLPFGYSFDTISNPLVIILADASKEIRV